ncbi:nodulation protein NolB (plasmid) [Bosea vestrisii]|uniref:nodulation protein NolB n=1 Tax=Bosea vestrisii TaxID=151416 RepID=UPI0024DFD2A4|nr:nodulation protein NolB [Bosea vestrisii]WID99710.1 nodulation protein NolB [Bosea vestrisii]
MLIGASGLAGLVDNLPRVASTPAVGQQLQFEQTLVQPAASGNAAAQPPSGVTTPVQPSTEVARTRTETASLGERILQNLSAVHRGQSTSAAGGVESALKAPQPGPAEQSLAQPNGPRLPAKVASADNFDAMIASLQGVYNNVIQVSLVSKSTGSVSSSVNKLMSAS